MFSFFSDQGCHRHTRLSVAVVVFMLFCIQVMDSRLQFIKQCDDINKIIGLSTFDDEGTPYFDVFGADWRPVCGKQAGNVQGNGTKRSPYKIWVDVNEGPASQEPQCGVKRIGKNLFELTVKFIKTCEKPSLDDLVYRVVCELNNIPETHTMNRIRPPHQVIANASHVCRPPSTIEFHYSQQYFMPFDIYAMEARKMCSKCSGSGRGRGSFDDPYILTVNFNDPRQWYGCHGTQLETNVYNLKILVQQAEFIVQNTDMLYNIICDFNQSKFRPTSATSGLTVGGEPPLNNATEESTKVTLNVVAPNGTTPMELVSIGDNIRLKISLEKTAVIVGLQVRSCDALPDMNSQIKIPILNEKGCPTGHGHVPPFHGTNQDGSVAMTDVFEAFKFAGHASIYFRCSVKFCYRHSEPRCSGLHCTENELSRRRRSNGVKPEEHVILTTNLLFKAN